MKNNLFYTFLFISICISNTISTMYNRNDPNGPRGRVQPIREELPKAPRLISSPRYTPPSTSELQSKARDLMDSKVDPKDAELVRTLHFLAGSPGSYEIIKELLEYGVSPDRTDIFHPLGVAAQQRHNNLKVIQLLLEHHANPNLPIGIFDPKDTPLHLAVEKNNVEMVKLLLKAGADQKIKGYYNKTPLELAKEKGFKEIVNLLEEQA